MILIKLDIDFFHITLRPSCGLHDNNFLSRDIVERLKNCVSSLIWDTIANLLGYIQVSSRNRILNSVANCLIVSTEASMMTIKRCNFKIE